MGGHRCHLPPPSNLTFRRCLGQGGSTLLIPITLPGSPVQGVGGTRVAPELKRLLSREGLGGENGFPNYFLSSHQERLIIFFDN